MRPGVSAGGIRKPAVTQAAVTLLMQNSDTTTRRRCGSRKRRKHPRAAWYGMPPRMRLILQTSVFTVVAHTAPAV